MYDFENFTQNTHHLSGQQTGGRVGGVDEAAAAAAVVDISARERTRHLRE